MRDVGKSAGRALSLITTLGVTMAASTLIGYFAGSFLDRRLGTYPWFVFFFSICGIAAGFKGIFRIIKEDIEGKR